MFKPLISFTASTGRKSQRPVSPRSGLGRAALFAFVIATVLVAAAEASAPPKKMVKDCDKGSGESCYWAGINQSSPDPPAARKFFLRGCALDYRKACAELQDRAEELLITDAESKREAVGHFEAACGYDYGRSCTAFATALWEGNDTEQDRDLAVAMWQKGCDLGSRVGCRRAGSRFEEGTAVAKDLVKALEYYQRSCDAGLESGCGDSGRLLANGVAPAAGVSAQTAAAMAVEPLRKACFETGVDNIQGDACLRLGTMYADGAGVERDPVRAFDAFQLGCMGNNGDACVAAAEASMSGKGTEKDLDLAVFNFGKACRYRSAAGCEQLCKLQCEAGQPAACQRVKKRQWPYAPSCAMP